MGKNIGIKLADGTFYPIMEEGIPKKKRLELTTVQDNQTTVMVDLYRSADGTMADAEYVDTLQISELVPHGNGEPNICLTLQLDEDNRLSAEVYDPESGTSSSSNVELVTRAETDRAAAPDFSIAEPDGEAADATVDDEAAFADDAFPAEFADAIPEDEAEALIADEPAAAGDTYDFGGEDVLSAEAEAESDAAQSPDFDAPEDSFPADGLGSLDVPESDPEKELGLEDDFSQPGEEPLPDFDVPSDFDGAESFQEPPQDFPTDEDVASADSTDDEVFPLPDFGDSDDTAFPGDPALADDAVLPDFDALPDFDDTDDLSATDLDEPVRESTLPDFSKFELPDFDDPEQNAGFAASANSGLFNEADFDDPAFQESAAQNSPGFDFSGLYDEPSDDEFAAGEKKGRGTASVVTCVICAVICLLAAAIVLFFLPSQIRIDISRKAQEEVFAEEAATQQEPEASEPDDLTLLPPQPEPKEDVIVISETPAVVPVPPPEPPKKPESVMYRIKWGDTLWDLADSYYNNPWLYKKLASANGIANPDRIISGTYIEIPPK